MSFERGAIEVPSRRVIGALLSGEGLGGFAALMARMVLASVAAALVVAIGSAGMLFTTGPEWASLIFEPVSLVLLPGLFVGMMISGPHDLDTHVVLNGTIVLYFLSFWMMLESLAWRRRRRRRRLLQTGGRRA